MKALIRRIRGDASVQAGANQTALNLLADKLEREMRTEVEAAQIQQSVDALREMVATVTRVAAEYKRLGQDVPFTWPGEKKAK